MVHAVALSPEAGLLAVGTDENVTLCEIHREDMLGGGELRVEPLLTVAQGVKDGGIAFSHDDGSTRGSNGRVKFKDDSSSKISDRSSLQRMVVASGLDVQVLSVATGAALRYFPRDEGRVRCVALSSTGRQLALGGFDRALTLIAVDDGARLFHYSLRPELPSAEAPAAAAPDDESPRDGDDSFKRVPRAGWPTVRQTVAGAGAVGLGLGEIYAVAASAVDEGDTEGRGVLAVGGERLVGGEYKGVTKIYDTSDGAVLAEWHREKRVYALAVTRDGVQVAVGADDYQVFVHELRSGGGGTVQTILTFQPEKGPAFIWSVAWSADCSRLAVGCWNCCAFVYENAPEEDASGSDLEAVSEDDDLDARPPPRAGRRRSSLGAEALRGDAADAPEVEVELE